MRGQAQPIRRNSDGVRHRAQAKGLDNSSSFDTDQQTILLAALATALPAIINVRVLNITAGAPGEASMLVGMDDTEPLTLEVRRSVPC